MSSPVLDPLLSSERVEHVDAAIDSRQSIRAFSSRPVDRDDIRDILAVASRAPSGANVQPWKTYVLQGKTRDTLVEKVCAAHDSIYANPQEAERHQEAYAYYPRQWISPYIERRRENGWGLYGLLGIAKGEKDRMHAQHQRNFRFFDAPVGLFFTVNTVMGQGALLDCGAFMQNIMIAARARGLDTCPQAAWNSYAGIILPHIGASEDEMLVCGMSLGWAQSDAIVNTFRTPRVPPEDFTVWRD
ncbi:nitroreductase [Pusillimonas sp.]|uniref:nitroreductase n=1 Tax=Pusillimonas sp. TaxID=3040095 RepID=UPI0037C52403